VATPRKITLLGNTGFVGRAVGGHLAAQGHEVRGFSSAALDLTRPESGAALAASAPADATIVLVAAITPDRGGHVEPFAANVAMATTVARHVERHGAGRVVFVSSDAVYGDRDEVSESSPVELYNAYAVAKFASERILACVAAARAIPMLVVRPTIVFGPGDTHGQYGPNRFVKTIVREQSVTLFGEGEEQRDHIFIDDLVEVLSALVAGEHTGVLNVATGESRSFGSVVDTLQRIAPFEFKVIRAKRVRPVTHRHFDVQHLLAAVPGLVFRPFEESLRAAFRAAQHAEPSGR
jgi:UDP-glucose 4-epimerase